MEDVPTAGGQHGNQRQQQLYRSQIIDGHGALVIVKAVRSGINRAQNGVAGIANDHIEARRTGQQLLHQLLQSRAIGQIEGVGLNLGALCAEGLGQGV